MRQCEYHVIYDLSNVFRLLLHPPKFSSIFTFLIFFFIFVFQATFQSKALSQRVALFCGNHCFSGKSFYEKSKPIFNKSHFRTSAMMINIHWKMLTFNVQSTKTFFQTRTNSNSKKLKVCASGESIHLIFKLTPFTRVSSIKQLIN